jgi:hypothetical protein
VNPIFLNTLVQVPCVIGSVGIWQQGRKHRIAPALGLLSEVAWTVWSLFAHAYGIIPWSVLWSVLYFRTWWIWRPDEQEDPR